MNERSTKTILQITKAKFPPEIRVAKQGISLHEAGFCSAVLCPPYDNQPEFESWKGIDIYRPKVLANRSRLDKFLYQAIFCSSAWYQALKQTIDQCSPDVLHVHDIWLGRTAFAARSDELMVFDLHENMPSAVVEYLKGYRGLRKLFAQIFQGPNRVLFYERELLEKSQMVFAVVEEAKERILINHPNLVSGKVFNIENLETKDFIKNPHEGTHCFTKDHFSVLYIGGFGPHRGIDTLVKAAAILKDQSRNIKFQLIGAQPSQYVDMINGLVKELQVEDLVKIIDWVSSCDVLANIQQADVCTVPHHSNPHTDNTIPHKLFQYMIARRPVLVSSSKPLERTVTEAQAGLVFKAGDPQDCAEKVLALANSPEDCLAFAENGYRYVMEDGHNWEEESAPRLIEAYDNLFSLS